MKILFVVPHYYPLVGGVEKYVQTLAEKLSARHEVVVVTSGKQNETVNIKGIKVYRLAYSLRLSNTPIGLLWYWKLRRIIRKERPDLINAHSPVPFMADMAALAKGAVPFVVTYHAGSMVKGSGGAIDTVLRAYERHILPRLFKKARKVVAIYKLFVDTKMGDERSAVFIPPGIDTKLFVPRTTKKKADITFVGRIQHTSNWKGLDVLLEAVALMKKERPDIRVRIVGDGDAVATYRHMAEAIGVAPNLTFAGLLHGKKLADAYRESRLVVLPSKTEAESFGMVLAEAQACGVPVIGSRIGGIPQVIDDANTGLLSAPGDAESLAQAALFLLKDEKRQATFGRAGAKRARELFSEEALVRTTEALFEKVRMSRIVHVSANYPPRLGGMENVVMELATEQYHKGRDVRVVSSRLGYDTGYVDEVPVKRLWAVEIAHTPLMPGLLWELLKLSRHDVAHVHIAQAFVPEMVRLASVIKGFRYVAHVHLDVAPSGPAGVLLGVYKPLVLGPMLRRASRVVVFTKEQRALMIERYGLQDERAVVVPNGVGRRFFADMSRNLHKLPRLLFVGRLSKQKNVPLLLKALEGVSERFETRIVGDGELRGEHEALARTLGLKNVRFYGRQDGNDLQKQYKEADIFVLPSEREGMPLVLLEAMAMALPIVGTDVTGIRDVVTNGRTGRLVPFDDVVAYRQALLELIQSPDSYQKMSQAALRKAERYSWPVVSRCFEELYEA